MDMTPSRLRELLFYDDTTGHFTWLKNRGAGVGQVAGSVKANGYIGIMVDRKLYFAHRLAWFYTYGEFPKQYIDHINGDRADNRIVNLREVTHTQNMHNLKSAKITSKTKILGVTKVNGRYRARIRYAGRYKHLGYFATPEEAYMKYQEVNKLRQQGLLK